MQRLLPVELSLKNWGVAVGQDVEHFAVEVTA
jgi:hypothetical protein